MNSHLPTRRLRIIAGASLTSALCAAALLPGAAGAAAKTVTLRAFSKPVAVTLTTTDGKVLHNPKRDPQPGETLDVNSLDYPGNHKHHAKHWTFSDHSHCVFAAGGPPNCDSELAVGGSLLTFKGFKLENATGRYQGATAITVTNTDAPGGSDIVLKLRLR